MIIVGTMEWKSTRETGFFNCPECGGQQLYRLRASRPFLTLYFIPVLPIGGVTEFVECRGCKTTFEPFVLEVSNLGVDSDEGSAGDGTEMGSFDQARGQTDRITFEQDLLTALAAIACEDQNVTEEEIRIARHLYRRITGKPLSREQFGIACNEVQLQHLSTASLFMTMAVRRTKQEKLLIVQAVFALGGASGELSAGRLAVLTETPRLLRIDESEFRNAVASSLELLDSTT